MFPFKKKKKKKKQMVVWCILLLEFSFRFEGKDAHTRRIVHPLNINSISSIYGMESQNHSSFSSQRLKGNGQCFWNVIPYMEQETLYMYRAWTIYGMIFQR